jgi:hypothetical protein
MDTSFGKDFASGVSELTLKSKFKKEYEEYRSQQMDEGIPPKNITEWYTDIKMAADQDKADGLTEDEKKLLDEEEKQRKRELRRQSAGSLIQ